MYPLVEEWHACPVCRSERMRPLHVYRSRRKLSPEPLLALLGCEACGVAHSAPTPTPEELDAYYTEPEGWESRTSESEEDIARALEHKGARYARQFELLRGHLDPPPADGAPRAFDFGCGLGSWLDAFEDAGWETFGLEPGAKQARVAARRHRMLEAVPHGEQFELAVLHHVLEHLPDPLGTVRNVARALVPGGQLFVSVPDLGRVHEHRKLGYAASDLHIVSFALSGLRSLLGLAGLVIEEHLETAEWDAEAGATRLRVLARKAELARFPVEESPLDSAVASLRELGRVESREAREETFDKARKVSPGRANGDRERARWTESTRAVATLKRLLRRR